MIKITPEIHENIFMAKKKYKNTSFLFFYFISSLLLSKDNH